MSKKTPLGGPAFRINAFFEKRLGAKVLNPRWSWGAYDPLTNSVFLRVWEDHRNTLEGRDTYRLEYPDYQSGKKSSSTRKAARNERARHLDLARNGAQLYGVLCSAEDPQAQVRSITAYNNRELVLFEGLEEREGACWGVVDRFIPVEEAVQRRRASDEAVDIENIRRDRTLDRTTRETLVDARLGQGLFREAVLERWGRACALTACSFEPLLRASHIKPWRTSSHNERLDPSNGLPLVAHLDALFDRGFISFTDTGELMISSQLTHDALAFITTITSLRRPPDDRERLFLAHHREILFQP